MHSAIKNQCAMPRLALSGFPLLLAKLGGIFCLWLGLWAALAASTALETPRSPQPTEYNQRYSLVSRSHLIPGER